MEYFTNSKLRFWYRSRLNYCIRHCEYSNVYWPLLFKANQGWKMKILVRNLDRSVTEAEVLELFKAYGKVESCVVVTDKDTGKSKGFGFVEMPNPREAIKAIKGLNTLKVKGYGIRVKAAEE